MFNVCGYFINMGYSLLTSGQLPHCCPHAFGVCLAVVLTHLCPTSALDVLTNADRQRASFLHTTCTHQLVLAAKRRLDACSDVGRVSAEPSDNACWIILIE